jgi:hypothetical protein
LMMVLRLRSACQEKKCGQKKCGFHRYLPSFPRVVFAETLFENP